MGWSFLKRFAAPKGKVSVTRIDSVHVSAAHRDDPKAVAAAEQMEEDLQRELAGVSDPDEVRATIERYEREHGMKELESSAQRYLIVPDAESVRREGPDGIRRILEELERDLEGADDPAERRLRAESFARERGWTIRDE